DLSLEAIARNNGISLRYLHELFTAMDSSVSDWIWLRRLQRCYTLLTHPEHAARSIPEIAFSMGFNSSSHFSNRFREELGLTPPALHRISGSTKISSRRWSRTASASGVVGPLAPSARMRHFSLRALSAVITCSTAAGTRISQRCTSSSEGSMVLSFEKPRNKP